MARVRASQLDGPEGGPASDLRVDRDGGSGHELFGGHRPRLGEFGQAVELLGTGAHALLHHSACPVAVVPHRVRGPPCPKSGRAWCPSIRPEESPRRVVPADRAVAVAPGETRTVVLQAEDPGG